MRGNLRERCSNRWSVLFAVLLLALLAGALLAPAVFSLLLWLGRRVPALGALRDLEFERVASRCVMVLTVVAVVPFMRYAGLFRLRALGLDGGGRARRDLFAGWLVGVLMLSLLVLVGLWCGAYVWAPPATAGAVALLLLRCTATGLVVGFIEEVFFRGVLFGVLRSSMRFWGAAWWASVFFSLVHFARPAPPLGVVHVTWWSGFELLGHVIRPDPAWMSFAVPAGTLLVMGLTLCRWFEARGHLYFAVGLHAGWVLVMLAAREFVVRDAQVLLPAFGYSRTLTKAPVTLLAGLLFFAVTLWWTATRRKGD